MEPDIALKLQQKFPYLEASHIATVLGMGHFVMLQEGEAFVKTGERSGKAAVVLQGLVRNYTINENGEEVTVLFATEMQPVGSYTSMFFNRPATETTAAVEPSILFAIDYKDFKALAQTDVVIARLHADIMEAALVAAIQRIEDFTEKNPEERYRRLLENHGFLIERAPLKYLASYLGITPVSLSRIRKRIAQR